MTPSTLQALDARADSPLHFQHRGERFVLPHPKTMTTLDILRALQAGVLREMPLTATPTQTDALFAEWVARHNLPDANAANRLLFLVDRYHDDIDYDLASHGIDIDQLFLDRQWRRLIAYIDRIPSNSCYSEAVANDEEHADMIARAMAERGEDGEAGSYHPPLRTWGQAESLLAQIHDAIKNQTQTIIASNGGNPVPVEPLPRPTSVLAEAQKNAVEARKKARHDKLVARMIRPAPEAE